MTEQERIKVANQIFKSLEKAMTFLYSRWQDEKDHEDFSDYAMIMQRELIKASQEVNFIKATKRPFGFEYSFFDFPEIIYQIKISSKQYSFNARRI